VDLKGSGIPSSVFGLVAFVVGEIQRAYGGDAYEHQDGGEQGEDNQWSLLVDAPCKKQLHRQP
jgi:hypothetical protein